ncbi:MAG: CBS domain-containing protein [Candidatus Kapabacteria bacterium]|jgi:CBS domain-containing protein|nr:CBS domain-containing protein [Candidatus Kapabacteria bacterium]
MKAKEILRNKGPEVFTVGESKTIREAMELLVNNRIGVLLVLNSSGKFVGIISERDILRLAHSSPDNFLEKSVEDVMTRKIIYADYDDDVDYIESMMSRNKVRHLPVLKDRVLVGLISIGDVVKASLSDKKFENKYLLDYISGNVK